MIRAMNSNIPTHILTSAIAVALFWSVPATSRAQDIYAITSDDTIGEFDATTGAPVAGFTPIAEDYGAFTLFGNDLYVTNGSANEVNGYNATTGAPIAGFTSPSNLDGPAAIVDLGSDLVIYNADAAQGNGEIDEYDAANGAFIASLGGGQ